MLINPEQISPVDIFVDGKYTEILEFIKEKSVIENPGTKTKKDRDLIKSTAAKIASSKVFIEKAGKKLADDERKKIEDKLTSINLSRNFIKDSLVYLKDEIREPLTKWENEKKAVEAAEKLRLEIISDHSEALEHNAFLRDKAKIEEEKKKLEAERIRIEAEETARIKAEAEQGEKQARILKEKAEAEAEAERLKQKAVNDAKQAETDKQNAIEAERKRVQAEADEKEKARLEDERKTKAAAEAKAADTTHRKKINNEALDDMNEILAENAFDEILDVSKLLIIAIAQGKIRNITINY